MITLLKTSRYEREQIKFLKNNTKRANVLIKTLNKFAYNPTHPSLNLEKLGKTNVWTIRIDKGNRIFFTWLGESSVLFIDIGKHDKYRRY